MKQLYLKEQAESVKLENVLSFKRQERNSLIDRKKAEKKAKDTESLEITKRQIVKVEQELMALESQLQKNEEQFQQKKYQLGKIRLNLYVFADVMYNSLLEYEEFTKKNVLNAQDDADTMKALHEGLDAFKKLPFEMGDNNDRTNELYNAITDKFIDRWQSIRDCVIGEVLKEVDKEYC